MEKGILQLGGNIELSGFQEIDGGTMIIIKKMVGNFVKKISESNQKFQKLTVNLKKIHEQKDSKKFELQANLVCDKNYNADVTHKNLLFALDEVLKKVEKQAG